MIFDLACIDIKGTKGIKNCSIILCLPWLKNADIIMTYFRMNISSTYKNMILGELAEPFWYLSNGGTKTYDIFIDNRVFG